MKPINKIELEKDSEKDSEKNKKKEKSLIGKSSTLKNMIRSELKKQLEERGINLKEYAANYVDIDTKNADLLIGYEETGEIFLNVKDKSTMQQASHVVLTKDDVVHIIDVLKKFISK